MSRKSLISRGGPWSRNNKVVRLRQVMEIGIERIQMKAVICKGFNQKAGSMSVATAEGPGLDPVLKMAVIAENRSQMVAVAGHDQGRSPPGHTGRGLRRDLHRGLVVTKSRRIRIISTNTRTTQEDKTKDDGMAIRESATVVATGR